MVMKVSLGGLNSKGSQRLKAQIEKKANSKAETMEEYAELIRLVRQSFDRKYQKPSNTA